ncbi:hypothetical protein CGC21_10380 [Leishmania donovani]|uniref:Uncharacterized protein n=1 Tax=Leishmania donovani TaxID=5661 RepID=A0A504XX96_LEIDO|nr:hypothetical protein CGC21_10380 [Leishmania donovani]
MRQRPRQPEPRLRRGARKLPVLRAILLSIAVGLPRVEPNRIPGPHHAFFPDILTLFTSLKSRDATQYRGQLQRLIARTYPKEDFYHSPFLAGRLQLALVFPRGRQAGFGALTVNLVKADGGAPVDFLVVAVSGLARRSGPGASSLPRRWGLLAVLAGRFGNQGAAQLSRGWPQGAVATVPRPRTKQPDSAGSSSEIPVAPSALCPVGVPLSLARVEHPSLGPPFGMALARSRRPFPVPHPAARAGTHPNNARAGGRRRPAPDRKPPCNQVTLNRVATRGVHPSSGDMAEKPGRSCRSLVL